MTTDIRILRKEVDRLSSEISQLQGVITFVLEKLPENGDNGDDDNGDDDNDD